MYPFIIKMAKSDDCSVGQDKTLNTGKNKVITSECNHFRPFIHRKLGDRNFLFAIA